MFFSDCRTEYIQKRTGIGAMLVNSTSICQLHMPSLLRGLKSLLGQPLCYLDFGNEAVCPDDEMAIAGYGNFCGRIIVQQRCCYVVC